MGHIFKIKLKLKFYVKYNDNFINKIKLSVRKKWEIIKDTYQYHYYLNYHLLT